MFSRTRVPLFMASSTFWLPLSAPIQASRQPALRSASAMRTLTRSARSWMVNGTPPPPSASAAANSITQFT